MATSGWNRPSANKPITPRKTNSVAKGLIAGLIVVIVAAIAAYFIFSSSERKPTKEVKQKKNAQIAEVTPAAAPKLEEETPVEKKEIPYWELPTTNGLTQMQALKWKHRHTKIAFTNDITRYDEKPRYKVFDTGIDNRLACYMTMEAGEGMVGTPVFDDRFRQEFEESLKHPIIIDENDDEYTKELKRAVREAKVELVNRVKDGEDICQIFEETHDEMMRFATMKSDIVQEFTKYARDPDNSVEDVEDYFKAANKLLEEKGVAPFKMSPVLKEAIRLAKGEADETVSDAENNNKEIKE